MHSKPAMDEAPLVGALSSLGWDSGWSAALAATADPSLPPGRVSRIDRGAMTVLTESGPRRAATPRERAFAVGDWVTIGDRAGDLHVVAAMLPRRSSFRRVAEGPAPIEQVVAANMDTVFLVNAIDGQLSVRHLQRYLAVAWRSGATPVIVISKADLAPAEVVDEWTETMKASAPGVAVHVVSTATGRGMADLAPYLAPGRTVALVGLSGAGKSTLVNVLAGSDVLATGAVRTDGQGRHTTTHRELVLLPGGGLIIDTPGMRALSVVGAAEGVRLAFADVEELAARCEFPDCTHTAERGCALQAAVRAGQLSADRLAGWLKLRDEPAPPDHLALRQQVTDRKQRKAAATAVRRDLRSDRAKAKRQPAAAGRPPAAAAAGRSPVRPHRADPAVRTDRSNPQ